MCPDLIALRRVRAAHVWWPIATTILLTLTFPGTSAASGSCGQDPAAASACPVTSPSTLSGTLATADETDYYIFYAEQGAQLSVAVSDLEDPACSSASSQTTCGDVQAELYDSQGDDLGEGTGSSSPSDGAANPSSFAYKINTAGAYYLVVSGDLGQDENGNPTAVPYSLAVSASPNVAWPEPPHPGWTVQPDGELTGDFGQLYAVSCTAATACTAAGFIADSSETESALLERWDGISWTAEQIGPEGMNSEFTSVSCASASWCMAIGFDESHSGTSGPLAYSWNGTRWANTPESGRLSTLGCATFPACAVSCFSSTACVAVGDGASGPAAVSWNGARWSVDAVGVKHLNRGGYLLGVSCTADSACTAVGSGPSGTFAQRWNGHRWTIQATPRLPGGGFLSGVSCLTATDCVAVGTDRLGAVAERWNGHSWRFQRDGFGGQWFGLDAVSCPTATYCVAAGGVNTDPANKYPTAAVWNGTSWSAIQTAAIGTDTIDGVSCVAAGVCEEVGSITLPVGRTDYGLLAQSEDDPVRPGVAVSWRHLTIPG